MTWTSAGAGYARFVLLLAALGVAAGCSTGPVAAGAAAEAGPAADADAGAGPVADAEAEAGPVADAEPEAEVASGGEVGPGAELPPFDVPAGAPVEALAQVDWALQGTPGDGGVLTGATLACADGGLLIAAGFRGDVTFDGLALATGPAFAYRQLLLRVDPDGAARFLVHLCDDCSIAAMAEASDGRLGLAGLTAAGPTAFVLDPDGALLAEHPFGSGTVSFRGAAATPDGGWLFAGDTWGATFEDGTEVVVPDQVFYPGLGFVVRLHKDLSIAYVEALGGEAGSSVSHVLPLPGGGFAAVGDFGGWPHGVETVFGAGPGAITLASVSSDDDPAHDLFVAVWDAPGQVRWARRVRSYVNGLRLPTFLRAAGDGNAAEPSGRSARSAPDAGPPRGMPAEIETRIDGALEVLPEGAELSAPRAWDQPWASVVVRFDGAGTLAGQQPFAEQRVLPWPGKSAWAGAEVKDGALELTRRGADGALVRRGTLGLGVPEGAWPASLHAAVPQPDGSFLVYLNGSADLVLTPGVGAPVTLDNTGYERVVVLRVGLVDP